MVPARLGTLEFRRLLNEWSETSLSVGARLLAKVGSVLLVAVGVSLALLAFICLSHAAGGLHLRIIVVDSPDKASQIFPTHNSQPSRSISIEFPFPDL
jgi:hypothetical protein